MFYKLKFQMVAEKIAKNFRGYFILPHPVDVNSTRNVCKVMVAYVNT